MKRLWLMVRGEPYRLFFPLGVLASVWGVLMWPMLYAGWLHFYPGEAHTRMMVEGFMGAFVVGFLGTAFPRLSGNRPWTRAEFLVMLMLWLLTVSCHAMGHVRSGDAAFCGMILVLLAGMAGRLIFGRRDTHPPGFVLVFTGILGAAVASGFLSWCVSPGLEQWRFARLWLFQGFLLLPLMGIGPYVLPRFYGLASRHSFEDSPTAPAGWWRMTAEAVTAGLLVMAGFVLEVAGHAMAGQLLRAAVVLAWFASQTPMLSKARLSTTPGNAMRWALSGLVGGYVCAAMWPAVRVGSLHLFFVSGLGLATLVVGTRVILGHAGRHDLLGGKILWLRWVTGLLILAAATRMSSEFIVKVRVSHHNYAAWTWVIAGIIWLAALARHLMRDDELAKPKGACPRRNR
jgi:uncharacterized protein involved in response to NO